MITETKGLEIRFKWVQGANSKTSNIFLKTRCHGLKKKISKLNLPMISPPEKFYHFIKLIYLFKLPLKLFYFKEKKIEFDCIHYTRGKITPM